MSRPDRRSRLRAATSEAHVRLDRRVAEAGFFDSSLSYAHYLDATLRARQPVELALDEWGAETIFAAWPLRRIASALRSDIRDISGKEPTWGVDPSATIVINSDAQALGTLYVLEGSALGARLLARRAGALGMTATFGARHLALQIAAPWTWASFLLRLETAPFETFEEAECVAVAIATFARFERAYSPGFRD